MGSLQSNDDLQREKDDVCFMATLVMGVGESLATIDERTGDIDIATTCSENEKHANKKMKRSKK